jgi:hypothetical protein
VAHLRLSADRALGLGRRLSHRHRRPAWRPRFRRRHRRHLNAGIAGLVGAYVIGKRRGYGSENFAPYDLTLAVIGTGLLWVGWFGFNGGSALGANSRATHLAASAGALTWMALEWWQRGKPSVLGMISGAVAGLGTITPASGFVLPWQGVVIGVIAGAICFWACTSVKQRFGYDDSLDVFGVHGVGGATGTLLAGVFAVAAVGGTPGLLEGNPGRRCTRSTGSRRRSPGRAWSLSCCSRASRSSCRCVSASKPRSKASTSPNTEKLCNMGSGLPAGSAGRATERAPPAVPARGRPIPHTTCTAGGH